MATSTHNRVSDLAADVRERHATAMQKLDSLKLALDDRQQRLRDLVANDARPRTAFLHTPAYIRALYDAVRLIADELRARLDADDVIAAPDFRSVSVRRERAQLTALVADLERELDTVAARLELTYRRKSANPEPEMETCTLPPLLDGTPSTVRGRPARPRDRMKTRAVLLRMAAVQRNSETGRQLMSYPKCSSFPQLSPLPSRRLPPLGRQPRPTVDEQRSVRPNATVIYNQNLFRWNNPSSRY